MKKLEVLEMERIEGGKDMTKVTLGCGAMGAAAMWASSPLLWGAVVVGTLTYAGCLLLETA
jgi:hypothetical protein